MILKCDLIQTWIGPHSFFIKHDTELYDLIQKFKDQPKIRQKECNETKVNSVTLG